MSSLLLPDQLVSMSSCLAEFLPDVWCIQWANASEAECQRGAEFFALTEDQRFELTTTVTAAFGQELGWPNVILELETARALATTSLHLPDMRILELGLHHESVATFCRNAEPKQQEGFAPVGRHGIHEALLKHRRTSASGIPLGFEPLLSDGWLSDSWLCHGLETVVAKQLQVHPNRVGLIETIEEARSVTAFIARDDVAPGVWLPWLIIDHTMSAEP